jgi:hypothetical protein
MELPLELPAILSWLVPSGGAWYVCDTSISVPRPPLSELPGRDETGQRSKCPGGQHPTASACSPDGEV